MRPLFRLTTIILALFTLSACVNSKSPTAPNSSSLSNQISSMLSKMSQPPNAVDYRASFAIFTNGTLRVFTTSMYHNLSPNAFITADNPNIVQVKRESTTWGDFFDTLPFNLTPKCLTTGTGQDFCSGETGQLKYYLNGKDTRDALNRDIIAGDSLLISFGSQTQTQIQQQLDQLSNISEK